MNSGEMKHKKRLLHFVTRYLLIAVGSAVFALGFQFFMYPNSIVSGGVTGLAMIVNRLCSLPVGVLTIVFNLPLFIIAWKHFGLDFLVSSMAGVAFSSVAVDAFALLGVAATDDPMLAAIIGGAIKGLGLGMIYYVGATTGGVDIVAKLVRQKYPHLNFGTLILILDVVIIAAYALIFRIYESAMYSLIGMYVVSQVIDLVLYGLDYSSICYIISERSDEIVEEIISGQLHRGVTLLHGEGAYSRQEKRVIMCVIKHTQIAEIRRMIKRIDVNAFVVVSDAKNVFGKGFESISEIK